MNPTVSCVIRPNVRCFEMKLQEKKVFLDKWVWQSGISVQRAVLFVCLMGVICPEACEVCTLGMLISSFCCATCGVVRYCIVRR